MTLSEIKGAVRTFNEGVSELLTRQKSQGPGYLRYSVKTREDDDSKYGPGTVTKRWRECIDSGSAPSAHLADDNDHGHSSSDGPLLFLHAFDEGLSLVPT